MILSRPAIEKQRGFLENKFPEAVHIPPFSTTDKFNSHEGARAVPFRSFAQ